MNNTLQPITENELKEKLNGFIISQENQYAAEVYEKFAYATLDVFKEGLSFEESHALWSTFTENNLKLEQKLLKFMTHLYDLNENEPVFVDMPFHQYNSENFLEILGKLDYLDKVTFLDQIRSINKDDTYFRITDTKQFELLIKLATRELCLPVFHFSKLDVTVVTNFGLAFPIYTSNKEDMEKLRLIAEKYEVFILENETLPNLAKIDFMKECALVGGTLGQEI